MKIQFSLTVGWNPYQPALLVTGGLLIANGFGAGLSWWQVWLPFFVTFAVLNVIYLVITVQDRLYTRRVNRLANNLHRR